MSIANCGQIVTDSKTITITAYIQHRPIKRYHRRPHTTFTTTTLPLL